MHQQTCLSKDHTHTRASTPAVAVQRIQCGQKGRRRKLLYSRPVSSQTTFPALARVWGEVEATFLCILLPGRSGGVVCLHLSSCHLTLQLTVPLELTVWSKETKKLKRAFPWRPGYNNTTAKLNHFSSLLSAQPPAYQLLPSFFFLSVLPSRSES